MMIEVKFDQLIFQLVKKFLFLSWLFQEIFCGLYCCSNVFPFFFFSKACEYICVHPALCMCISFLPKMPVLLLCIFLHGNFFLYIVKCYLFIHSVFNFLIAREHFHCFVHWYRMQIQRTDSSFRIFAYFFSPPSAHSPNLVLSSATSTSGPPFSPGEGSHHL